MKDFTGVFFTGDRMLHPLYPGLVMTEMLRAVNKGKRVLTGTNDGGIEWLVREFAKAADVEVEVREQSMLPGEHDTFGASVDWDARHLALPEDVEVLLIHVDHETCRESRSALAVLPEDRVRMVTMLDLLPTTE